MLLTTMHQFETRDGINVYFGQAWSWRGKEMQGVFCDILNHVVITREYFKQLTTAEYEAVVTQVITMVKQRHLAIRMIIQFVGGFLIWKAMRHNGKSRIHRWAKRMLIMNLVDNTLVVVSAVVADRSVKKLNLTDEFMSALHKLRETGKSGFMLIPIKVRGKLILANQRKES